MNWKNCLARQRKEDKYDDKFGFVGMMEMEKTIDECFFQIQNGVNIKQGNVKGGFPITRIETTADNKFNRDRMGYAGITDISKYEPYILEDGDLLMSHINSVQYLGRTVLYVKQSNEIIIHGMNLLRLKARKDVINPAYARYCFYGHSFRSQIMNITKKSVNQASFAVKDLKQIKIDVPSIDEQNMVVVVLDKLQKLIDMRKNELAILDNLIKARFVEMFGNPEANEKEWKMNTFGDICTVRQGLQIPISKRLTQYEDYCYEYITVQYLHGGKEREYIKNPKTSVICTQNDILMTRTGNTGMVVTGVDGVFHNNFFLIDFDRNKYDKDFLVQYLKLDIIQADILRRAGTSTIPDLNHSDFYKIKIFEPPIELQKQFTELVNQVDKSKVAIQKSLDEAQLLFDSLMQKYFG